MRRTPIGQSEGPTIGGKDIAVLIFAENTQIAHKKTGRDSRKHARELKMFCKQKRTVRSDGSQCSLHQMVSCPSSERNSRSATGNSH